MELVTGARVLVAGEASAPAVVLDEPLSLWGGFDPATGRVVDRTHPQAGVSVAGAILVMPGGRGSSSSSAVLAEAARAGTAPAAVVLATPDDIIALGAIVAAELYGVEIPVVVAGAGGLARIRTGDPVVVRAGPGGAVIAPG